MAGTAYALLFVGLLARHGEYRPYISLLSVRETERLLRVMLQTSICALLVDYVLAEPLPRIAVTFAAVTIPATLAVEKRVTRKAIRHLRNKGYGSPKAVILGTGSLGRQLYSVLARSAKFGLDPIGFVDEDPAEWGREIYECSYERKASARVLSGSPSPELLKEIGASVLLIATQDLSQDSILRMVAEYSAQGMSVYFVPAEFSESGVRIEYGEVDGILLGHTSGEGTRTVYETGKRVLDVGLSMVALAGLGSLMAGIALFIKATSPGPVLFKQIRVGKDGKTFSMLKFRSMFVDAPTYAFSPTENEDPRITPLGRFLRRTSLDELPQLFNVLVGDMSLVGPRPEMPFIAEQYSPVFRERLKVKPGITGLWQLSADRAFLIHDNIEYDLYYVRHRSLFIDVAIMLHTLVFAGRGI